MNEKNTHVVGGQEGAEEKDIDGGRELILGWVMGGHVNDRVDVGLRTEVCKCIALISESPNDLRMALQRSSRRSQGNPT